MRYKPDGPRRFLFFILVVAVAIAVAGGAVMLLWNAVLPAVGSVRELDYPQGLGLLLLCRILFGGFGKRGTRSWGGHRGVQWREKWKGMSDADRTRFREEWKARCAAKREHEE